MALVAHLRGDFVLGGHFGQLPRLGDVVAQRLLAVDALAQLHGDHRRQGVMMVGGGDEHGVDLLAELVEHLAVIVEALGLDAAFARGLGGLRRLSSTSTTAKRFSSLVAPRCDWPRPPQPISTQFSLLSDLAARTMLGKGKRDAADRAPPASAARFTNERRVSWDDTGLNSLRGRRRKSRERQYF